MDIIKSKIDADSTYYKVLIFLLSFFVIMPPINNWIKLVILSLSIIIIFSSNLKRNTNLNYLLVILFIILFIPKAFISSYSAKINHIVLPTASKGKFNYVKNNFDKEMSEILKEELNMLLNKEDLLKGIHQPGATYTSTLYKNYAFQAENVWTNFDEGKKIILSKKTKNFWDLGPSALNDRNLNFGDTKKKNYGTNLVFPVLFKLDLKNISKKSKLCYRGNIIFQEENKYQIFKNDEIRCLKVKENLTFYFLDYDRQLQIKIKKNYFYDNLIVFFYIIVLLQLTIIFYSFIEIRSINKFYIFLNLIFYIILFLYFKYGLQAISGFSETIYFKRGMDGMAHYGYARIILTQLFTENYFEAFRGVESTFYYMPLLRYINAISMIFFGETILGSILIISLFGILIYKFLNLIIEDKSSKILSLIFLIIPLFEALGFSIINYIGFTVDGYAEGLAYFFLLLIVYFYLLDNKSNFHFFLIGFISFLIIGLRPNYLVFLFSLIFLYSIYLIYIHNFKKKIYNLKLKLFLLFFGTSFFFLFLIHNYFYSNEIVFLVERGNIEGSQKIKVLDYWLLLKSIFSGDFQMELFMKIYNHFRNYIKYYEFWFIITFINLLIVLLFKFDIKFKILSLSLLLMHCTYLLFLGTPRYSMGTWLISFLVFIYAFNYCYYPFLKAKFFQKSNR